MRNETIVTLKRLASQGDYPEIVRMAEKLGYVRSPAAIERESEENTVGQYGITLDEAWEHLNNLGYYF